MQLCSPALCVVTFFLVALRPPLSPSASKPAAKQTASVTEVAAILHELNLPPLTYAAESVRRFDATLTKLSEADCRRLADKISELRDTSPNAPELATLLPVRWRTLARFPDFNELTVLAEVGRLKRLSVPSLVLTARIEELYGIMHNDEGLLLRGQAALNDEFAVNTLIALSSECPTNPAVSQLWCRRLQVLPPGEPRDAEEKLFLATFAETPTGKRYLAAKSIGQPVSAPFELPKDGKPTLLHFYVQGRPWGEAHLPALQQLQDKYSGQFHLIGIPLGTSTNVPPPFPQHPDPGFVQSQGLTDADLPLTYILAKDGTLASIRYDTRFEKPLIRLLKP